MDRWSHSFEEDCSVVSDCNDLEEPGVALSFLIPPPPTGRKGLNRQLNEITALFHGLQMQCRCC